MQASGELKKRNLSALFKQTCGSRGPSGDWKVTKDLPANRQVFQASASALRLNHRRHGANDDDDASTRTGTDYRSNNIGDSNADNSPRSIPDKGYNNRVRPIYQSNRQRSLFEAR